MKRVLIILISFILAVGFTYSQEYQEILREIFYDAEFFLLEESYIDAVGEYQKLYSRGYQDNANINYRIGTCYLNIPGEKVKAIPYFKKAVTDVTNKYKEGMFKETKAPYDAWLYLGNAYRINNQLDEAVKAYNSYKDLLNDPASEMSNYCDKQIEACNNARKEQQNPIYLLKTNQGEVINTATSDFNPVLTPDESLMVYMTSLKFYDAIKMSRKVDGLWSEPINITPEIQSDGNQFVNSISKNGDELFLNREDEFDSDIYSSKFENGKWEKSSSVGKMINTKFWESHASISPDGQFLYFSSNRKEGQGGTDIFVSKKDELGSWGPPENLGQGINTELNEDHPFISEDGDVLYFVSQGHYNIGGYDIFYSERLADGSWGQPKNLGYPLNTTDDDMFFVPLGNGKYGYQAIFSEENTGSRDIYRFQLFENEKEYLAAIGALSGTSVKPEVKEDITKDKETEVKPDTETPKPPPPPPPPPPVEVMTRVFVLKPVYFAFDSYTLSAESKSRLDIVAEAMITYSELEIEAVGHADARGSDAYNIKLSGNRAKTVIDYLSKKGVAAGRMKLTAKGESDPLALNSKADGSDLPEGRKYNRRVDISISKNILKNVMVEEIKVPDHLKK